MEQTVTRDEYETFLENLNWDFIDKSVDQTEKIFCIVITDKETRQVYAEHFGTFDEEEQDWKQEYVVHAYPPDDKMKLPRRKQRLIIQSWDQLQKLMDYLSQMQKEADQASKE